MQFGKKIQGLFFLGVFSILLLHQSIPHYDHYLEIEFHHHGEHSKQQHDEPKGDFERGPARDHSESSKTDYVTATSVRGKKKTTESSEYIHFYPVEYSAVSRVNVNKVNKRLVLFDYSSLCPCTYSLRGPPQFV